MKGIELERILDYGDGTMIIQAKLNGECYFVTAQDLIDDLTEEVRRLEK